MAFLWSLWGFSTTISHVSRKIKVRNLHAAKTTQLCRDWHQLHSVCALLSPFWTCNWSSYHIMLRCINCEVHLIICMILGYAYHFKETGGARLTNGKSVLKIPSVFRLLEGLNVTRKVISKGNALTFKHNKQNGNYGLGRNPTLNAHEMLHRILNSRVYHGQDSPISPKFQSRDSDEQKGTFKISDETVSGKGGYTISSDQTSVGIKMKLRINTQQIHQQQKQQQQPKPTMGSTLRSTTPQMCVVPCNTKLEPQAANCIRK